MNLPELKDWTATRTALHQAVQVIGAVRRAVADPQPNWVHLGVEVTSDGVETELPLGKLALSFADGTIAYRIEGHTHVIGVNGHSQSELVETIEATLREHGYPVALDRDKLHGEGVLRVERVQGAQYAQVLDWAWARLRNVRGSLDGHRTSLVLWPHGFDAAFLWFESAAASSDETDPHIGIGFSPGSPGLEQPYFFVYGWPLPDGLTEQLLPEIARWQTEGWTGAVIDYQNIRELAKSDEGAEAAMKEMVRVVGKNLAPNL